MINSWWDIGEGHGQSGENLALYQIECPFCREVGKFELEHHAEKRKPNSDKKLNFDTYKCVNCAGFVQIFWSASEYSYGRGLHDYLVQPYPLDISEAPDYIPDGIKRFWLQAHRGLSREDLDATVVMARSALQAIMKDKDAQGSDLKQQIDDLAGKGLLTKVITDWSHELRMLGNQSAHSDSDAEVAPNDAKDIVEFMDYLFIYLYKLPKQIEEYKNRDSQKNN